MSGETVSVAYILSTLSIVFFVMSVIALVGAVFLWFWFKIPNVIGDLSGKNARKTIARMREENEKEAKKRASKAEKASFKRDTKRGITAEFSRKEKTAKQNSVSVTATMHNVGDFDGSLETTVLNVQADSEAETSIHNDIEETTFLAPDVAETTLLTTALSQEQPTRKKSKVVLTMLDQELLIHTDEVI